MVYSGIQLLQRGKENKVRLYTGREKRGTLNILWRNG